MDEEEGKGEKDTVGRVEGVEGALGDLREVGLATLLREVLGDLEPGAPFPGDSVMDAVLEEQWVEDMVTEEVSVTPAREALTGLVGVGVGELVVDIVRVLERD